MGNSVQRCMRPAKATERDRRPADPGIAVGQGPRICSAAMQIDIDVFLLQRLASALRACLRSSEAEVG